MLARGSDYRSGITASMISIRAGGPNDRAFVDELGKRTLPDSVAAFRYRNQAMIDISYERLLEIVFAQSHVFLIAEQTDAQSAVPVGFALMLDTLPDEVTLMPQGFVAYMAVEPRFRRSGTAAKLLAALEDEARTRGLPYMGLMVTEENVAALSLYEDAGYLTERRLMCKTL